MVVDLSERIDSSLRTAIAKKSASGSVLGDRINISREREVIRKGIERSEKLILKLISTRIPTDYVDISLIRKCNTIDLPALQSATKTCEKSLLKYLSFPDADNSYCDRISALLDQAEAWGHTSFGHTLTQRFILLRVLLEILLTSVYSLTMGIKLYFNFLNHLSSATLIGVIISNALVNYLIIYLMISRIS